MAEEETTDTLFRLPYIKDVPGFKIVTLSREYDDGFEHKFSEVKLREPNYKDIFMSGLGRPFEWQPGKEGSIYISFPDVVAKYVEKILVSPEHPTAITLLGTADSLRMERAVLGFFTGPAI